MKIEVGDRVTYTDGTIQIIYDQDRLEEIQEHINETCGETIKKIERPEWQIIEEKKELLTEEERGFLKHFLQFTRNKCKSITIRKNFDEEVELIIHSNSNGTGVGYCYNLKKNVFKNLEDGEFYTLEELGLEE